MKMSYFAVDGSYGSADDIIIVDTGDWSEDEWDAVTMSTDTNRLEVVRQILDNASDAEQLELEFPDDAG